MHKIPSLFKRNYDGSRLIYNEVVEGCEWVAAGEGVATEKFDGTAALYQDGKLFKRYDAKQGKTPPDGFIPAQDPDPVTGHWPGWLPVTDQPDDQYFREALMDIGLDAQDGTYELVGKKVQGNPYGLDRHALWQHGSHILMDAPRDFDSIRAYLEQHAIEGIVWHHPDGRMCKVKRKDFGFKWGGR